MCCIEHFKLATGDGFDGLETPDWLAVEKLSGVLAPKRSDHTEILTLNVINVKRYYHVATERGTPRVNGAWICSELSIHLSTRLPEFYRFFLHAALQRLGFGNFDLRHSCAIGYVGKSSRFERFQIPDLGSNPVLLSLQIVSGLQIHPELR